MSVYEFLHHEVLSAGSPWEAVGAWHQGGIPIGIYFSGAPVKWAQGIDGAGRVVGVVDSGIDGSHPDLQTCPDGRPKLLGERDYTDDPCSPSLYHWHGTHVAGTVAANGLLRGMAPGAQLRSYRVFPRVGGAPHSWVRQAVLDAVADGCHVINLSLGSREYDAGVHQAIQYAVANNVVVVTAAGNEGPALIYPAYLPEVISTGAIGFYDDGRVKHQWFSTYNDQLDVCANGIDVLSTIPGGLYMLSMGTSMAGPHVAGEVALIGQVLALGGPVLEPVVWYGLKYLRTVDVEAAGIDAKTGMGYCTAYPALPKRINVSMTTNVPARTVNGQTEPLDVGARMLPVPGTAPLQHRTYTPPRHTHEPLHDHVGWEPGPNDAEGRPTGTATISRWLIPGMEQGQPIGRL